MKVGIAALRADEALGDLVELAGADARDGCAPRSRSSVAARTCAGARHLLDLLGRLLDDHLTELSRPLLRSSSSRRSVATVARMWAWTSSGERVPSKRRSSPARVVVGDQRLGLARGRPRGAGGSSPRGRRRAGSAASRPGRRRPRAWAGRSRRGRCGVGFLTHTRRPARRAHDLLVGHLDQQHAGQLAVQAARAPRRARRPAPRCAGSRRAGSRRAASPLADALDDHADDHLVGDELAGVHVALGLAAQLGLLRRPARAACRRSRCAAAPKSSRRRSACVPLPAPGGPSRIRFSSDKTEAAYPLGAASPLRRLPAGARPRARRLLQEALVAAHHQLRLELLHRFERDADHDQDRGAAEVEVLVRAARTGSPAAPRRRPGTARPGRSGGRGCGRGIRPSGAPASRRG